MTDIDIDAIRARAEAATPGPWEAKVWEVRRRSRKTRRLLTYRPEDGTQGVVSVIEDDGVYGVMEGLDAEFIAHAREDVPALLAEVERLRGYGKAVMRDVAFLNSENDRLRAALREKDEAFQDAAYEAEKAEAQVQAVRTVADLIPHVGDCTFPDEACSCRAIEFRVGVRAALDTGSDQ